MSYAKDKESYIAYVLGRVETQIEGYAASGPIPLRELSRIVGEFLCGKASGELLRGIYNMPALPEHGGRVGRPRKEGREAMAEMAVSGDAHSYVWSPEARANLSKVMKAKYAAKAKRPKPAKKPIHWTQTPKGRAYMAKTAKQRFHGKG